MGISNVGHVKVCKIWPDRYYYFILFFGRVLHDNDERYLNSNDERCSWDKLETNYRNMSVFFVLKMKCFKTNKNLLTKLRMEK